MATDAGREGELIFRYLYHYIGCATPFVRLWISSLTDKAIRDGLRNLEAGGGVRQPLPRRQSAEQIRQLVGINGTQALHRRRTRHVFRRAGADTHVGDGVRTLVGEPPLYPEAFWQLHIATDGCDEGTVKFSSSEKWKEKESATELYNKLKSAGTATVTKAERKEEDGGNTAPVRPDHAPEGSQRQAWLHGGTDA